MAYTTPNNNDKLKFRVGFNSYRLLSWSAIKAFFASQNQDINFDASVDPAQTGNPITKTSTWLWQYCIQGINWLKANKAALVHTHTKSEVGLGNVDNTSDVNKPVSTAQAAAISAAINALINGAPGALDALNELAAAMGNDPNFATTVTNALAGKVDKVTGKSLVYDTEILKIHTHAGGVVGGNDLKELAFKSVNLLGYTGTVNTYVLNALDHNDIVTQLAAIHSLDSGAKAIILESGDYGVSGYINLGSYNVVLIRGLSKENTIIQFNQDTSFDNIIVLEELSIYVGGYLNPATLLTANTTVDSNRISNVIIKDINLVRGDITCIHSFNTVNDIYMQDCNGLIRNCKNISNIKVILTDSTASPSTAMITDSLNIDNIDIYSNISTYHTVAMTYFGICNNINNIRIESQTLDLTIKDLVFNNCSNISNFSLSNVAKGFYDTYNVANGSVAETDIGFDACNHVLNTTVRCNGGAPIGYGFTNSDYIHYSFADNCSLGFRTCNFISFNISPSGYSSCTVDGTNPVGANVSGGVNA